MTANNSDRLPTGGVFQEKILLALLPFWTPQIPPLGISCLKAFLQPHGYAVKTIDANIEPGFNTIYYRYFDLLKEWVPEGKRGNFYNIGNDVLRNHMMAHINCTDHKHKQYLQLVKQLIYNTFYWEAADHQVVQLSQVLSDYYRRFERYFLEVLEVEKPAVLGLSLYSGTLPTSVFAIRLAKEMNPQIKTIAGGGIFADQLGVNSPDFEFFLAKTPYIDKIIIGEGEILLLKLLRGELPEGQRVYTLNDIAGQTLDLEKVGIPDFSDLDLRHYTNVGSYVSRSCPFQCTFCSETLQWGKYRKKNARQIIEESEKLYKTYGYQLLLMGDSLLNPIITDMANEFIKSGISIYWDGYLRADKPVCDIENTLLWRRGGFYRARLGLESGSPRVLEIMRKRITPPQIEAAVSALANAGIKTTTYWVIGHPGETEKDFRQTLALIEKLKNNIYEAECNPFNYYLTGQVNSREWSGRNKNMPLYPESARDMLMVRAWKLAGEPSREETYRRVARFVTHCRNLEIPNPYSMNEICEADERWKNLHKNAVPSLVEFKNTDGYIDENRNVKKFSLVQNTQADNEDFDF